MNRSIVVVVIALLLGASCTSELRVTVLTEAPPTGRAELVDHGTAELPDLHLALSRAIAVGLECSERDQQWESYYAGSCRDFAFSADDDDIVTPLAANLDALAVADPYASTAAPTRTGLVLIGGQPGTTVLHIEARGATLDITVDVDDPSEGG